MSSWQSRTVIRTRSPGRIRGQEGCARAGSGEVGAGHRQHRGARREMGVLGQARQGQRPAVVGQHRTCDGVAGEPGHGPEGRQPVDRQGEQRTQGGDEPGVGGRAVGRVVGEQAQEAQMPPVLAEQADRETVPEPRREQVLTPGARLGEGDRQVAGAHRWPPLVEPEAFQVVVGVGLREVARQRPGVPCRADRHMAAGLGITDGDPCRGTGHHATQRLQECLGPCLHPARRGDDPSDLGPQGSPNRAGEGGHRILAVVGRRPAVRRMGPPGRGERSMSGPTRLNAPVPPGAAAIGRTTDCRRRGRRRAWTGHGAVGLHVASAQSAELRRPRSGRRNSP